MPVVATSLENCKLRKKQQKNRAEKELKLCRFSIDRVYTKGVLAVYGEFKFDKIKISVTTGQGMCE